MKIILKRMINYQILGLLMFSTVQGLITGKLMKIMKKMNLYRDGCLHIILI